MSLRKKREIGFGSSAAREGIEAPATSALFVRIPRAEAEKLDRAAFELKRPKQDLVAALVARHVDPDTPSGLAGLRALEVDERGLTVGRHSFRPAQEREVLTVEQLAELLQVDAKTVRELAGQGELPGRKVGSDWRFSRQAVLEWLSRSPRREV